MKRLGVILFLITFILALTPLNHVKAQGYTLRDLGYGEGLAINDLGQITGWRPDTNGGPDKAFFWSNETSFADIGPYAGQTINNSGQTAGNGWLWSQESGLVSMSLPTGTDNVSSNAINNNGQVAGWVHNSSGDYDAVVWNSPNDYTNIGVYDNPNSWAYDINQDGLVVGEFWPSPGEDHAFKWSQSSGFTDLGNFNSSFARADGVNDVGQIVGQFNPEGSRHAFLWSSVEGLHDLGTLSGGYHSQAVRINDNGLVVGWSMYEAGNPDTHAFLWNQSDGMIDLGLLGGNNSVATDINSSNEIVGTFRDSEGKNHIALWEPVPTTFTIEGKVNLLDFVGDVKTVPIEVELRNHDGETITRTLTLTNDGSYNIENIPQGEYDIAFKASHWLRKTVLNTSINEDTTLNVTQVNGDVDGDNNVDVQDQELLKKANGSTPNSHKWNSNADLNGDLKVNKIDLEILKSNLGLIGDI